MKRLTYISRGAKTFTEKELEDLSFFSETQNNKNELTGVLFSFEDYFYQILEGPEKKLDECFNKISKDKRHDHIFVLNLEENISERKYPNWGMKNVNLDKTNDVILLPLRSVLNTLTKIYFVIEKYTSPEITNALRNAINPLEWKPKLVEKIIIFADIYSSTTLAETFSPEKFNNLLSNFYEIAIKEIGDAGGIFSKFTGDGFMAYFNSDNGDEAIVACKNILEKINNLRNENKSENFLKFLHVGIGISSGKVYQGNIGNNERLDFTLLGDAVNTAARLEAITRKANYYLVFDASVYNKLNFKEDIKRLGYYQPKGKIDMVDVYTIKKDFTKINLDLKQFKIDILASKWD